MSEDLAARYGGNGEHHLFLGYEKYSRDENGERTDSITAEGMSGGAVVDAGNVADPKVFRSEIEPTPRAVKHTATGDTRCDSSFNVLAVTRPISDPPVPIICLRHGAKTFAFPFPGRKLSLGGAARRTRRSIQEHHRRRTPPRALF